MSFLQAEWRKLALINYSIDPKLLDQFLPAVTEIDYWENKCYASIVGFMFLNTKLLGIKIPFHSNFEEVNLRFYVKRFENNEWKRGVVFIKEIVPKAALSFVANTVYKEHYETMPMRHNWCETKDSLEVTYEWENDSSWNTLSLNAEKNPVEIKKGSSIEFITEHYWGYAKVNESETNEYEVTHPKWLHYPIKSYDINIDFGSTYGKQFKFLSDQKPDSVILAEGSKITVEAKIKIRVL